MKRNFAQLAIFFFQISKPSRGEARLGKFIEKEEGEQKHASAFARTPVTSVTQWGSSTHTNTQVEK